MSNPSGRKGYDGEWPVWNYLWQRGFRRAYRLRTQGVNDKGDIGGIDNLCLEIKNHGVYKLAVWMRELAREKANAAAATAALVIKPKGVGDTRIGQWWVMMTLDDYVCLIERAGYGPYEGEPCTSTVTASPTSTSGTSRATPSSSAAAPILSASR